jgi:hypothetical protein
LVLSTLVKRLIVIDNSNKRREIEDNSLNPVHAHSVSSAEDVPTTSSSIDDNPILPDPTPQSFIAIGFKDVLTFLLEYEANWPDQVVSCPWNGVPLPSIDVKSAGLNGRLELSLEMTLALINFGNNLSLRSKVPD